MKLLKNKKGAATDLFIFLILSFIFVVVVVVVLYAANVVKAELIENKDVFQKSLGNEDAETMINNTFGAVPDAFQAFKWITVMFIVGMVMSILISSYIVTIRPVFFVAHILMTSLATIIAVPIRNVYETLTTDAILASTFTGFWGQTFIFLNLHIWVMAVGIISGIIMAINMVRIQRRSDIF